MGEKSIGIPMLRQESMVGGKDVSIENLRPSRQ
jgi:hypothetical protein